MSYYRLYFMSTYSGHIERFEEFDAADDNEAIAVAETKRGPLVLELWCSRRKVARLDSLSLASQLLTARSARKAVKAQLEPATSSDELHRESRSG